MRSSFNPIVFVLNSTSPGILKKNSEVYIISDWRESEFKVMKYSVGKVVAKYKMSVS
jgi:hypothetical protein